MTLAPWLKDGMVVTDGSGHPIMCDHCPCGLPLGLYAGGMFTTADGNPANHIARWDGSTWSTLGSGTNGQVNAITQFGTVLVVGGDFTSAGGVGNNSLAKWDGTTWAAMGSTSGLIVTQLVVVGSDLYVSDANANKLYHWTGSTLSSVTFPSGAVNIVSMTSYGGGVTVAFTTSNPLVYKVALWNGSSWTNFSFGTFTSAQVFSLITFGGDLWVQGTFQDASFNTYDGASWNGSSWTLRGSGSDNGFTNLSVVYTGVLITSGAILISGTVFVLFEWTSSWSQFGSLSGDTIYALGLDRFGNLVVAGAFASTGNNIKRWNGSSWVALAGGVGSDIYTLCTV